MHYIEFLINALHAIDIIRYISRSPPVMKGHNDYIISYWYSYNYSRWDVWQVFKDSVVYALTASHLTLKYYYMWLSTSYEKSLF